MKESVLRLLVGFVFWVVVFQLYNFLVEEVLDWKPIIILSVFNSVGSEFIVPRFVKWGQEQGWISKS